MLNSLADASSTGQAGNLDKTKTMVNEHITPKRITVASTLEVVQEYVYFGQILLLGTTMKKS